MLDDAAVDAVRQWKYTPTLLNGVAVPVIMTVTVNFTPGMNDGMNGRPDGGSSAAASVPNPLARVSSAATRTNVNPFLLTPTGVGRVRVGMLVSDLDTVIPRNQIVPDATSNSGRAALNVLLEPGGSVALVLTLDSAQVPNPQITQIDVRSERFKTPDGLGVGSTLGDLRARDASLRLATVPGYGLCVVTSDMTYTFVLDATDVASAADARNVVAVLLGSPIAVAASRLLLRD